MTPTSEFTMHASLNDWSGPLVRFAQLPLLVGILENHVGAQTMPRVANIKAILPPSKRIQGAAWQSAAMTLMVITKDS